MKPKDYLVRTIIDPSFDRDDMEEGRLILQDTAQPHKGIVESLTSMSTTKIAAK